MKGPQCVRLPLVEMIAQGAFVVLAKAKLLGVHTDRYQLFIQEFESPGKRFTFLWGQDS